MKILFALFTIALLSSSLQGQDVDCLSRMKKGVFVSEQSVSSEVIRTSKEYVELFDNGDAKLFYQIEWLNDSTYITTMKRSVNVIGSMKVGEQIRTIISGCKGDSYQATSYSNRFGRTIQRFKKLN